MCVAMGVVYSWSHTHEVFWGCQKLIKGPIRLNFDMWFQRNWMSIINDISEPVAAFLHGIGEESIIVA